MEEELVQRLADTVAGMTYAQWVEARNCIDRMFKDEERQKRSALRLGEKAKGDLPRRLDARLNPKPSIFSSGPIDGAARQSSSSLSSTT